MNERENNLKPHPLGRNKFVCSPRDFFFFFHFFRRNILIMWPLENTSNSSHHIFSFFFTEGLVISFNQNQFTTSSISMLTSPGFCIFFSACREILWLPRGLYVMEKIDKRGGNLRLALLVSKMLVTYFFQIVSSKRNEIGRGPKLILLWNGKLMSCIPGQLLFFHITNFIGENPKRKKKFLALKNNFFFPLWYSFFSLFRSLFFSFSFCSFLMKCLLFNSFHFFSLSFFDILLYVKTPKPHWNQISVEKFFDFLYFLTYISFPVTKFVR